MVNSIDAIALDTVNGYTFHILCRIYWFHWMISFLISLWHIGLYRENCHSQCINICSICIYQCNAMHTLFRRYMHGRADFSIFLRNINTALVNNTNRVLCIAWKIEDSRHVFFGRFHFHQSFKKKGRISCLFHAIFKLNKTLLYI